MTRAWPILFTLFFWTTGVFIFSSCDRTRIYEKYKSIENAGWQKDSLVVFKLPVYDTSQNHNLLIGIRNDVKYPYRNLWLFVEILPPSGETIKDTFEIALADPSGKWLGKGIGGIKTRQAIYRRNVYFPDTGSYSFSIQHGMRQDVLQGIHDIGLRVEKANN